LGTILAQWGDLDQALEEARKAQVEGKGQSSEWEAIFLESMALGRLGRLDRGEMEKARESYRRFYEFWKNGDLDRESVEAAGGKQTT
jgi:Flp pilus assembly protein TadD